MNPAEHSLILAYHSLSEGSSPLKTAPSVFREQMEWLAGNVHIVSLGEIAERLEVGQPLPKRSVALTFDDAFRDFYVHAAPVLRRLGFAATVFIPTAFCGKTNRWPGQPGWVDERPLMDWAQIAELAQQGIHFGSHSVTHPDLTRLSREEVERELRDSRAEIESRTGSPAMHFCYPYGRWSPAVRDVACGHYRAACTTSARTLTAAADRFALPRVDVHYVRQPARFRSLFSRRFVVYLGTRRLIRLLRGAPEGS